MRSPGRSRAGAISTIPAERAVAGAHGAAALADPRNQSSPRSPTRWWGSRCVRAALGGGALRRGAGGADMAAHLVTRRMAPGPDPLLLAIAWVLNGIGLVMVRRIDYAESVGDGMQLAPLQTVWTVVGVAASALTLIVLRDHTRAPPLPLHPRPAGAHRAAEPAPAVDERGKGTVRGSGCSHFGFSLPARRVRQAAASSAFFASSLAEKRPLLATATSRLGPSPVPPLDAFAPIAVAWAIRPRGAGLRGATWGCRSWCWDLRGAAVGGDAAHRLRAERQRSLARWGCGSWTVFRTRADRHRDLAGPVRGRRRTGVPARAVAVRAGLGGITGRGPGGPARPSSPTWWRLHLQRVRRGVGLLGRSGAAAGVLHRGRAGLGHGPPAPVTTWDAPGWRLTFAFALQVFVIVGGVSRLDPVDRRQRCRSCPTVVARCSPTTSSSRCSCACPPTAVPAPQPLPSLRDRFGAGVTRQVRRAAWVTFVLFGLLFVNLDVVQVLRCRRARAGQPRPATCCCARLWWSALLTGKQPPDRRIARSFDTGGDLREQLGGLRENLLGAGDRVHSLIFGRAHWRRSSNTFPPLGRHPRRAGDDPVGSAGRARGAGRHGDHHPGPDGAGRRAPGPGGPDRRDRRAGPPHRGDPGPRLPPQLRPQPAGQSRRRRGACGVGRPRRPTRRSRCGPGRRPSSIHQARRSRSWSPRPRWRAASTRTARSRTRARPCCPRPPPRSATSAAGAATAAHRSPWRARWRSAATPRSRSSGLELGADRVRRTGAGLRLQCRGALRRARSRRRVVPAELDPPSLAQSAIGQRDVRATAVQMAMTVGAIGNGGLADGPADGDRDPGLRGARGAADAVPALHPAGSARPPGGEPPRPPPP